MQCPKRFGGCFKVSCTRTNTCQEQESDTNFKVVITLQKTYLVHAESSQEALNKVVGKGGAHSAPLPNSTVLVNATTHELK